MSAAKNSEIQGKKEEDSKNILQELPVGRVEPNQDANKGGNIAAKPPKDDGKTGAAAPSAGGASKSKSKPNDAKENQQPTENQTRPAEKPKPKPTGSGPHHNIEDEEQKKEYLDGAVELQRNVKQVAKWIREGKHVIFFSGAGISTGAGIPDFRSGMDTMLETGPGAWELKAHGKTRTGKTVKTTSAIPTVAHMALVALHEAGLVKFTVSQNTDGLHRRSGLNTKQLAELHGNTNLESCSVCGNQYLRDFRTREAGGSKKHETSRRCDDPSCGNVLFDSIINFGETLPESEITAAFEHAEKADVCIVLGSSLTVTPAADIPATVAKRKGKLAICNLQKTPLHKVAALNIHSMCDVFMKKLVEEELKIPIPSFKLKRRAKFSIQQTSKENDWEFNIGGLDVYKNIPYSFIREICIKLPEVETRINKEPFSYKFTAPAGTALRVILAFQGHYHEPDFELVINLNPGIKELRLAFEVAKGSWAHELFEMD